MGQVKRLARFGGKFASDRKYRNHVLDVISRHVQAAESSDSAIADVPAAGAEWLRGRKVFLVGGCELTYLKDSLAGLGAVTSHTFDHGGAPEPLAEASNPGSELWAFQPDVIVLSQVQLFRGVIAATQAAGPANVAAEQEANVDALVASLETAIGLIRKQSQAPIFAMTSPLVYRPALGIHEYRSIPGGLSTTELLRAYELRLYQLARRQPQVYVLDLDRAFERTGKAGMIDDYDADGVYEHLTRKGGSVVAAHLVRQMAALEPAVRRVKCVAMDLDNTLWSGVIREDGPTGVAVRENYLTILDHLSRRGILLAICSKNDRAEAEHLPSLLGAELFAKFAVVGLSWEPKSATLREIARQLNIGLDTLALVDDSPFERAEVQANAPEVLVLTDQELLSALDRPEFEPLGELTAEAATRATKYVEQARRESAESQAGSLESFLMTAGLELSLRRPEPGEVGRVFELLQRTNQLNATLRRTSREQVEAYYADPARYEILIATLKDKFGDYGLIGLAVTERDGAAWQLLEFAFSCRAMGKQVERALLLHLAQGAKAQGAARLQIDYKPTDRNGQVREILESVGFAPHGAADGEVIVLVRGLGEADPPLPAMPGWLAISA